MRPYNDFFKDDPQGNEKIRFITTPIYFKKTMEIISKAIRKSQFGTTTSDFSSHANASSLRTKQR